MSEKVREYKSGDLTVLWNASKCIHSEKCWRGLGEVFKPRDKPWIQLENTDNSRIVEQVKKCPSGALDFSPKESTTSNAIVAEVVENGPMLVKGELQIKKADGSVEVRTNSAFCRCGASQNKPYCDGSHKKINFIG